MSLLPRVRFYGWTSHDEHDANVEGRCIWLQWFGLVAELCFGRVEH